MNDPAPCGFEAPIFSELEWVHDQPPHGAAFNMALDEALLECLSGLPVLRTYSWAQPAVSFGYFEPFGSVETAFAGREAVRRWTGGGLVEHGRDFTYSLILPRSHWLSDLRAEESYRLLHGVVARALVSAGGPTLESWAGGSARLGVGGCFSNPVPHDLLLADRKVAGAAQRRTRRGWLHQGSIQLAAPYTSLYQTLAETLPSTLADVTTPRSVRPVEQDLASRLAVSKYETLAWTHRF